MTSSDFAAQLFYYLKHPDKADPDEFQALYEILDQDDVFDQLRIVTDQFTKLFPLIDEIKDNNQLIRIWNVVVQCSFSPESADLLAKEKRIWTLIIAKLDAKPTTFIREGITACDNRHFDILVNLLPRVSARSWRFALRCGLLERILEGLQKKSRTCESLNIFFVLESMLDRPETQRSIESLVSGGLFSGVEHQTRKSGNLLKGTPACRICNWTEELDFNMYSKKFLAVSFSFCAFECVMCVCVLCVFKTLDI